MCLYNCLQSDTIKRHSWVWLMLFWLYAWHNKQWKIMCLILCLSGSLYSIIYLILLCCSATNTFFSQFVVLFERRFHYFITQSEPQTVFFFLNVIINWRNFIKRRICGKHQNTTNIIYSLLMKKNLALEIGNLTALGKGKWK